MEMIDVLTKLKEIAESKPELVKDAVDNVEKTNPKVDESAMKNFLHDEAEKLSRKDFIAKHGESLSGLYDAINGTEDDEDKDKTDEQSTSSGIGKGTGVKQASAADEEDPGKGKVHEAVDTLQKELNEYKEAVTFLRDKLHEVNILNANFYTQIVCLKNLL